MDELMMRSAEQLTRVLNRRRFLAKTAAIVFGGVAASAADFVLWPTAARAIACTHTSLSCSCSPPGSVYCTSLSSSYCSGSACAGGCSYCYTCGYPDTACWCTQTCCASSFLIYYECCDCTCSGTNCGCRKLVNTCASAPVTTGKAAPQFQPCC